jgi:hypothetical protein
MLQKVAEDGVAELSSQQREVQILALEERANRGREVVLQVQAHEKVAAGLGADHEPHLDQFVQG